MGAAAQALAFLAGANSLFTGDRLLTAGNAGADADSALLDRLGMNRPTAAATSGAAAPVAA
jgi:biotin synthase